MQTLNYDTAPAEPSPHEGRLFSTITATNGVGDYLMDIYEADGVTFVFTFAFPEGENTFNFFSRAFANQNETKTVGVDLRLQIRDSTGAVSPKIVLTDTFNFAPVEDASPDAFDFERQDDVPANSIRTSNTITPTGYTTAPISVIGREAQYAINGGAFTGAAGTISAGQTLQVRFRTEGGNSTISSMTVTIGNTTGIFETQNIDNSGGQ
jgi:hypothetical protein